MEFVQGFSKTLLESGRFGFQDFKDFGPTVVSGNYYYLPIILQAFFSLHFYILLLFFFVYRVKTSITLERDFGLHSKIFILWKAENIWSMICLSLVVAWYTGIPSRRTCQ